MSSGVYSVTVNYLEYNTDLGRYVEKGLYYSGEFIPVENSFGGVFSTMISMPLPSFSTPKEQVIRDIVIGVWTNTTQPNPLVLMEVKAPISLSQGGYVITEPYRDQSDLITKTGITVLIIALFLFILSVLRKQS